MESEKTFIVRIATPEDHKYAELITEEVADSAKKRGTGIAKRTPEYVINKMDQGKAVMAVNPQNEEWVGFCYIEAWQDKKYVANSGLIVNPKYRGLGVARKIKSRIFRLSREKYPHSKIFGLTTGLAVMHINSDLGYEPVTYSELTDDDQFWKGCQSCINYPILMSKGRKQCLCTAMLYNPDKEKNKEREKGSVNNMNEENEHTEKNRHFSGNYKLFARWTRFKKYILLKGINKKKQK
ncbi:MAG TPA: GNAT family N-acetyltransferase [Chitinophagaceae bacterium]|nr:GNAT family N-acetyltransferase [Chitinophagaceae bacterium]